MRYAEVGWGGAESITDLRDLIPRMPHVPHGNRTNHYSRPKLPLLQVHPRHHYYYNVYLRIIYCSGGGARTLLSIIAVWPARSAGGSLASFFIITAINNRNRNVTVAWRLQMSWMTYWPERKKYINIHTQRGHTHTSDTHAANLFKLVLLFISYFYVYLRASLMTIIISCI